MPLNMNIDFQTILERIGRAYRDETGDASIVSTVLASTGPQFDIALARNLVSSYTNGGNPVSGSDYDVLSAFASNLRSLEIDIATIYNTMQSSFLASEFAKLNAFVASAFSTDIRTYLNNTTYNSATGPVYDIHGGFAQSYLNYYGSSLIFKVAEIRCSGPVVVMTHGPMSYYGTGGLSKTSITSLSGPTLTLTDENIPTALYTGPNNLVMEYGITGSVSFSYIYGSSGAYRTLSYPRIYDAGYAMAGPTGISFQGLSMTLERQPIFRYPNSANIMLLKAVSVVDNGDRDFVFKMVNSNVQKAMSGSIEQTQIITVAGVGDTETIVGTGGNTAFYRPFSLVSATGLQNGEVFEIWVTQ